MPMSGDAVVCDVSYHAASARLRKPNHVSVMSVYHFSHLNKHFCHPIRCELVFEWYLG